jgi:hypothetical protein
VTGLRREEGPNLFAVLGDEIAIPRRDGRPYRFRGGHRLWASPEIAAITYALDERGCEVTGDSTSVTVAAPPDEAGMAKEIELTIDGDELVVAHRIDNANAGAIAAWGITQLPLGGTALLSMEGSDSAPLPDRGLVLWPYTSLADPRMRFEDDAAIITAGGGPPLKIGLGPGPRRLGYLLDGSLFLKEVPAAEDVPDRGAVAQIYVGQGFCELEGVGGLTPSDQGPALLVERWRVVECPDLEAAKAIVAEGTS